MTTLTIAVDDQIGEALLKLSASEGANVSATAARLLSQAVRAARPGPSDDLDVLRAIAAEFEEEDLSLAESDLAGRFVLLEEED